MRCGVMRTMVDRGIPNNGPGDSSVGEALLSFRVLNNQGRMSTEHGCPCDSVKNAEATVVKSKKSVVVYGERDISQRYRKGSLEKATSLTRLWTHAASSESPRYTYAAWTLVAASKDN